MAFCPLRRPWGRLYADSGVYVGRRTDGCVVNRLNPFMAHTIHSHPMNAYSTPYATQPINDAIRHSQVAPWWSALSANERHPVLLTLGAALIVGMLLAFIQVVSGAVEHGEALRAATAAQQAATAHCTAMRSPSAQEACRVEVAAADSATTLIATQ